MKCILSTSAVAVAIGDAAAHCLNYDRSISCIVYGREALIDAVRILYLYTSPIARHLPGVRPGGKPTPYIVAHIVLRLNWRQAEAGHRPLITVAATATHLPQLLPDV